ncbi:AraC family transcriptional regulator [Jiangella alba]|uniref:AraC family transcriptional regulator n=1 Tax=Jiangella alba TaxID=561176 RepID=UPI00083F3AC8|nr:AraC family transcriptional regulator [Jiangella alba]
MDVLGDVIMSARVGRPRSARVSWHAPWGQRFPSVPGSAAFQVLLRGSSWLIRPEAEPVLLGAGDVVFSPNGQGYGMASDPSTPLAEPRFDPQGVTELVRTDSVGDRGPVTVTLYGGYHLDPVRTHPMLRDLPDVIVLPSRTGQHPELRAAIDLLGAEIDDPRPGSVAVVPGLLDVLLVYVLRAWLAQAPTHTSGWAAALTDPGISEALRALHEEPGRPWTVRELAGRARMSRATFARRFTALIGQPPLRYLTWWRLTSAAHLLRDTDESLERIANRVGYSSEFAFATAFKRQHEVAPGRYRRRSRTSHHGADAPGHT